MTLRQVAASLLLLTSLSACQPETEPQPEITGTYEAEGVVVRILENSRLIQIRHGEIDGFMPAMTMPFEFRADSIADAVSVDDSIHFGIATDGVDTWITSVRVVESR